MKGSKYFGLLKPLLKRPFFRTEEAHEKGIPSHALCYFCKCKIIKRVSRGIYSPSDYEPKVDFPWENLALIASATPNGVICLISALCLYDLTDQIMREIWLAVPRNTKPPKRPNTRIIRMKNIELGRENMKLGEYKVQIFDRERTIVDAFRFLSKEIAIKALQAYLSRTGGYKPDLRKLDQYATLLGVDLTPYILSLTT